MSRVNQTCRIVSGLEVTAAAEDQVRKAISQRLLFPSLGINSDNDGAFINETLIRYCAVRGIELAWSHPYREYD